MPGNPRAITAEAEKRFPVTIRIAVPPSGLGRQLDEVRGWLDANCGAGEWAMAPSGVRGVVNDALAIYFSDAALASAFVARRCIGYRVQTVEGSFKMRADEPAQRHGASLHKTP